VRRIGKVVSEQIALYSTVTGRTVSRSRASAGGETDSGTDRQDEAERLAEVVRLPERTRERRGVKRS
jgi:hypothetical protein